MQLKKKLEDILCRVNDNNNKKCNSTKNNDRNSLVDL